MNCDTYDNLESSVLERRLMQIEPNLEIDYKKVDSKDNMWKPAPILGMPQSTQPAFTYSQPTITSSLRSAQPSNYVLPSHFNRVDSTILTSQKLE